MTDTLDLDAIEARANAATPGPWGISRTLMGGTVDCNCRTICPRSMQTIAVINPHMAEFTSQNSSDCDFIAHARTDVPALIAEVRRLRAIEQRAKNHLREIPNATARFILNG